MKNNSDFDPNSAAPKNAGIFGLPFTENEARLVLIPVPWEATTSYGAGTSLAPKAILKASHQVDLYDLELGSFYKSGIFMQKIPASIVTLNSKSKRASPKKVNPISAKINKHVYDETKKLLASNKVVGLVGGDHSAPFGCIQAHIEKYPKMGILHFDAHADLRNAYEGYEHSHASIMFNVIHKTPLAKLVQVGIRDFCEEEHALIQSEKNRIKTFFDENIQADRHAGKSWKNISEEIISELPQEVYISFDIDGLDPRFCPHTGTPVPGGLDFQEALTLIKLLVKSGKKIVGFDLNEVAPGPKGDEWDANVGARMLFKLCGWTLQSSK